MAARLTVPDMSTLATLMPGRESTITVPAGLRVLIAVPDPARTSLMISPSSVNPVALSTIATQIGNNGLQFPTGIKSPHLLTWDIYGSKVQDPWYLDNLGATDLQVTVIEVVSRPQAAVMTPAQTRSSLQPLKSCLPRFKPPIYPPPDDEQEIPPSPDPGNDCYSAGFGVIGDVNGPYTTPIGQNTWWRVATQVGNVKLVVTEFADMMGAELYQGDCNALSFIGFGNINPPEGCISGFSIGGDVIVHLFPNGLSPVTFKWQLLAGTC